MNPVTAAHIHLILCHIPAVVMLLGFGVLAFGWLRRNPEVQNVAVAMFIFAALVAVPLYLTGGHALGIIKGLPGTSDRVLERHQAAAGITLAAAILLGVLALAGAGLFRRRTLATWFNLLLLAGALVAGGLMIWTGGLGGQIRHSEIRPDTVQP